MKELRKYSLVYHNPETNTFTLHRQIHKKVLGLHHLKTIKTLEDYASFLRKTKRADEASLLEDSVKTQKIAV